MKWIWHRASALTTLGLESIKSTSVWVFTRVNTLAIWTVVLVALWILWNHSQNGRYSVQLVEGNTTVLDTRTGTVYERIEGGWAEFQPQTGATVVHHSYRAGILKP